VPGDALCLLSATEQAGALRAGSCSARELVSAHLERIARVDPLVNAIVTRTPERALAAADEADRRRSRGEELPPLHGLPIAHKDLQDTAGVRTTYGSPSFRDHVPEADSLQVERLRGAGAILVGKTNTPEWGAGSHTFNPVFGATRNAWDTTRSAGGSSGGAAVALACRMLPIADGSDLGGSLRNPAAWSGVLGLRPTPGLVPRWPVAAPWLPFAVEGPMARTAGDLALLLGAMAGGDPRDPLSQRDAQLDVSSPLEADLRGRRVAWSPTAGGLPIAPAVRDALAAALPLLAEIGLDVGEDEPDFTGADEVFETWRAFMWATGLGDEYELHRDEMKATVRSEVERGRALTSAQLMSATRLQAALAESVLAFFERYDYLACPVTQVEPFPIEQEYAAAIDGAPMGSYIEWMRSNSRISSTCCPAISVPVGFTEAGLPVGLQLVTRPFGERALLEVAHALELRTGLAGRIPPLAADLV
jgi:amidase